MQAIVRQVGLIKMLTISERIENQKVWKHNEEISDIGGKTFPRKKQDDAGDAIVQVLEEGCSPWQEW